MTHNWKEVAKEFGYPSTARYPGQMCIELDIFIERMAVEITRLRSENESLKEELSLAIDYYKCLLTNSETSRLALVKVLEHCIQEHEYCHIVEDALMEVFGEKK